MAKTPEEELKGFWDSVAKGIEQARDPVAAAVKAIADGEADKERLIKQGVAAAIKAQQDGEKEVEKALNDSIKEQEQARKKATDKAKKDAEDEAARKAELNKKVFEGLTTGVAKVGAVVTGAMNALTGFGNSLANFVGKANPAAVQRFTLAVDDATAVIGRSLTPVLEKVTLLVQRMGNAFVSLSPTAQGFISGLTGGAGLGAVLAAAAAAVKLLLASLGPIPILVGIVGGAIAGVASNMASAKALGDAFSKVLGVLGTAVEAIAGIAVPLLTTAIEFVTPLIEEFAKGLTYLAGVITDVLAELGLVDAAKYDPNAKSATGAAVRQASIGDLSSFANKNYTSAYGGATQDVPKKQLSQLEQINAKLDALGYLKDGTRKEDRQVLGSSGLGRALNPFEKGTDGKSNFRRGLENLGRNDVIAAMANLF